MPADYKGAIWSPTQNMWSTRSGHQAKYLIIHGTGGFANAQDVVAWFQNPASQVSSTYIIDLDGTVYQVVAEADTAWGNCCYTGDFDAFWQPYQSPKVNANFLTISIEHVKPNSDNSNILTAAQQAASFALVKDICTRNSIPMRPADYEGGITGHFSMDRVNKLRCPGPYPWDKLWAYLGTNYTPLQLLYTIAPITNQYNIPATLLATIIQAECGWNFAAAGDKQYSASGKDPTSFGLFQLHIGGQAPKELADYEPLELLNPVVNAQYGMPSIGKAWIALSGTFNPLDLNWWEQFGSQSGHPGGQPGDTVNSAEAKNLMRIYNGALNMTTLSKTGEVAEFRDVDQFQPAKTEYACGFFSTAIVKAAGKPGTAPTQDVNTMITEAENWYAQDDGDNSASNMLGMSLQQEYDLIVQAGLHFQASNMDPDSIRAWVKLGYAVMVAIAEPAIYDEDLGGNPYPWTPAGNHILVVTGIQSNGIDFLVRDPANCTDLFNPDSLRPGPRRYPASIFNANNLVSATAVVLSWLPRPPANFDPRKDTLNVAIDSTTPGVSAWFKDLGNGSWQVIRAGKYNGLVIKGGILSFYRNFGPGGLNGLTWLGLPTTLERPVVGAKNGQVEQVFEKGRIVWDTTHLLDNPAGIPANSAYTGHVDILGYEAAQVQLSKDTATQAQDVTDDTALTAQITALTAQVADLQAQLANAQPTPTPVPTNVIPADVQAAIDGAVTGLTPFKSA